MPAKPNLRRRNANAVQPAAGTPEQASSSLHQVHAEPPRPNPYPHRLSVDVDSDTYRTLRLIAANEGCRLIDVVRSAIAHEIKARQ